MKLEDFKKSLYKAGWQDVGDAQHRNHSEGESAESDPDSFERETPRLGCVAMCDCA